MRGISIKDIRVAETQPWRICARGLYHRDATILTYGNPENMSTAQATQHTLVTMNGIPVKIEFQWPYYPSPSGADWFVLHGKMSLLEGSGRWAAISVHLTQTVFAKLQTLDQKVTLTPSLCTACKTADTKNIEFLKSDKLQPVVMSSRVFSVMTQEFTFHNASAEQIADYIQRKVFWQHRDGAASTLLTEEADMMYLGCTADAIKAAAKQLAEKGLLKLDGEKASATDALKAKSAEFEAAAHKALDEIDAKHAYERTAGH